MIVAVINFTLLLIVITMGLAVFISSRLTAPLTMLESGLASVELGKKIKHLSYKSNDEVGDLVNNITGWLMNLTKVQRNSLTQRGSMPGVRWPNRLPMKLKSSYSNEAECSAPL